MKKILSVIAVAVALVAIYACSGPSQVTNQTNTYQTNIANVHVTWDNITTSDAAYQSFKISDADVQHDVLRSLLTEAENRIYDVKGQEDLAIFKSKVLNIKRYYSVCKKESIAIDNRITDLLNRIAKVEEK